MRLHTHLLAGGALCAMIATIPAAAQDGGAPADTAEAEVIVTGIRGSLQSAQGLKRNADQSVCRE